MAIGSLLALEALLSRRPNHGSAVRFRVRETHRRLRVLREYDNLVLSHAVCGRIIADEYRKSIFLSAGRVRATFLEDGFVRGAWEIEKSKSVATW